MRILFLSHYYPPEVNAPASRTSEHCRAWAKAGHEVTVVTCAPNHPAGRIYPGYRNRLHQSETIDGVRVIRLWTFIAANEGFFLRTLNYLSYLLAVTLAAPRLPNTDVIVSTTPQFFCGLAGLAVRLFKHAPWVLEVRDLWPESIVTVGAMRKGVLVRLLERLEASAYARADAVVSVTDSFVSHIAERRGTRNGIAVIKNGVDLDLFKEPASQEEAKRRFGLEGRFVAAYVGTHGLAHGLDTLLEAAVRLRNDKRIVFLFVGDGAERTRLQEEKARRDLANVVMLGQQPKEAMPDIWTASDASLIHLVRSDLFRKVIPSKMFEAMAMRRPIVLGVEGEARSLLDAAGAGIAVTPDSAEELAAAVVRLADDPALASRLGGNGRDYVRAHFDRRSLAASYVKVLESAVAARSGYHAQSESLAGDELSR